jgi:hypothetical protein
MPTGPVDFDAEPQNVKLPPKPIPVDSDEQKQSTQKREESVRQHAEWVRQFEERLPLGAPANDPYFYVNNASLTKEQCENIIKKFENQPKNHRPGVTGGGHNPLLKRTKEINVSRTLGWQEEDTFLCGALRTALSEYAVKVVTLCNNSEIISNMSGGNTIDTGYQIQKYDKGQGIYNWHHDFVINSDVSARQLTFLWYINDVEEGGETLFFHGKIKPKAGTLIIFPATWNYNHKGCVPTSGDKYIITGWVSNKTGPKPRGAPKPQDAPEPPHFLDETPKPLNSK